MVERRTALRIATRTPALQVITRVAGMFFILCLTIPAVWADQPPRALAQAVAAAERGAWDNADRLAARQGEIAQDIVLWMRLRAGRGDYAALSGFLERRPHWPGEDLLRRRSESAVVAAGDTAMLKTFKHHPPQTPDAALAYVGALSRAGSVDGARTALERVWTTLPMDPQVQAAYLRGYGETLKPLHWTRLDSMLWRGERENAARMLPLVPERAALAQARLALQSQARSVDARIAMVPEAQQDDPGLAHDRFQWRVRKGLWSEAKALALDQSAAPAGLGQPWAWANRRRALARDEMRDGSAERAYELAAGHGLTEGSDYADLEWLAGYIALRKQNDPERALPHFRNHQRATVSPISAARAGYWIGRALESMGQQDAARSAYLEAARYQEVFYGLLAAERAGAPVDPALTGSEPFADADEVFANNDLYQTGLMLFRAGRRDLAERFWTHLAEGLDRPAAGALAAKVLELDDPHIAVMIGKRVAQRGISLHAALYALHPVAGAELPMAPEMTLSIARRESEFDARVRSPAGARGLMQIMPGTGRDVARSLGIRGHSTERMVRNPSYNARLGTAYLSQLAGRFDGNVVLMAIGYNAGPGRAEEWQVRFGDPRRLDAAFDIVDWIEHIPFRETRNYVMRVTESLPIYRALLGREALPVPFTSELTGNSLVSFAR